VRVLGSEKIDATFLSGNRFSYLYSIESSEKFWDEKAKRLSWFKKWNKTKDVDFLTGKIEWFIDGEINASYNCIDRHIENGFGDETAIIWEGNDPSQSRKFTYNKLLKEVSQFANALKDLGVNKGDRVCLYMQMIPELAIAVLACARIGAVHSVVFGAFSSDSLKERINDSECKVLVTQDTGVRGEKQTIPMKVNADNAVKETPSIEHVIVVRRTGEIINMDSKKDIWWHEAISGVSSKCTPEKIKPRGFS
jgi:acetyl-CoA synthetase